MGNLLHYQNDGVEELAETRNWIEWENGNVIYITGTINSFSLPSSCILL